MKCLMNLSHKKNLKMCIKCSFDEEYFKVYDIKKISSELKNIFPILQKNITLAGRNIPQFLVTGHLEMACLSEKNGKKIIKCRINKPWIWKSNGYRAVFIMEDKEEILCSRLLLFYTKNHCPDNRQETQWIWSKLEFYYADIYQHFRAH